MELCLHHIALAVESISQHQKLYETLFGAKLLSRERVESERVSVAYLALGDIKLELVEPLEGNVSLRKFLDRKGEGLHHLCFQVQNIEEAVSQLSQRGATFIEPVIRSGSGNTKVAFLHPKSTGGILIELKEVL